MLYTKMPKQVFRLFHFSFYLSFKLIHYLFIITIYSFNLKLFKFKLELNMVYLEFLPFRNTRMI